MGLGHHKGPQKREADVREEMTVEAETGGTQGKPGPWPGLVPLAVWAEAMSGQGSGNRDVDVGGSPAELE